MFEQAMDSVEAALVRSGGPYFMGAEFTLGDCVFASSLERIAASILCLSMDNLVLIDMAVSSS